LTGNLLVSVNTTSARRARAAAAERRRSELHARPRVFVRRHTGGLTTWVGGRAGGMSWCGQMTRWADQMTVDFNSPRQTLHWIRRMHWSIRLQPIRPSQSEIDKPLSVARMEA